MDGSALQLLSLYFTANKHKLAKSENCDKALAKPWIWPTNKGITISEKCLT